MAQQFPDGKFPEGECSEHPGEHNRKRTTGAEYREKERLLNYDYEALRKAAECHRQVRKYAQSIIKPGMKLIDICNEIENTNRRLIEANKIEAGIAFPTGCSINHCAAHYTPNPGDMRILEQDDVMKIDFGTHVRGLLVDCAFTVAFNPVYDNLLLAVKEATNTGLREAGIDARLNEIGEKIQETMESFEVEIKNKVFPVKAIRNLSGHLIAPYHIHAGKSVPIVKGGQAQKVEEGELYAVETFGSTGK